LTAQDIHYSQFYNSPININPALTGIFNGDIRFNASLRDQWRGVPVPWTTASFQVDKKFYGKSDKGFFAGGLLYNYDKQGQASLILNNINLTGSYTRILHKNHVLTGGLMAGYSSRGFDPTNLQWDRQWVDGDFFASIPSGEIFDVERVNFVETAAGINYRLQKNSRTKIDLGAGAYHLVRPEVTFNDNDTENLARRFSLSAVGSVKLTQKIDFQLNVMQQFQESYRETILGVLGKFYINEQRGKVTTLELGLGYRTTGALFPTLALRYNEFYVSGSYDIDLTAFGDIHGNNGGPEIHFRYIFTAVKPLKYFKICPIF
jgi:type IX secretion system PorP/SprF family membrane protein